jgi:hypothetical protein
VSSKFNWKNYWKNTPKKWRKFGDAILAMGTFLAMGGLLQMENLKELYTITQIRTFVTISMVMGVVGKFLTNFFKDKESADENNP